MSARPEPAAALDERYVVTAAIDVPADAVFAVLSDPARHRDTEPGDWVRDAVDTARITAVGDVFAVNMYLEQVGGHYVMHNLVSEFEPDRRIAWMPGQLDDRGDVDTGGWIWRYELTPEGTGTSVTLTYDWSDTPVATREEIGGMPPFPIAFLQDSLDALATAVRPG